MHKPQSVAALLLLFLCATTVGVVQGACGDAYNRDDHLAKNKLDICSIQDELPDAIEILTNWGSRPQFIDSNRIVFLGNVVGDVFLLDLETNEVRLLTGHFTHAGFLRVHVLRNGDLLLHGPSSGPQPPLDDPLTIYDVGSHEAGAMSVLQAPLYNAPPVPLGAHAHFGIAVSRVSNRIAWSNDNIEAAWLGPNGNFLSGIWAYLFGQSNIMTAIIAYDETTGLPSLTQQKTIVHKWWFDPSSYEPQDFRGSQDEELTYSQYSILASGFSNMHIYNFEKKWSTRPTLDELGYDEWEGSKLLCRYGLVDFFC